MSTAKTDQAQGDQAQELRSCHVTQRLFSRSNGRISAESHQERQMGVFNTSEKRGGVGPTNGRGTLVIAMLPTQRLMAKHSPTGLPTMEVERS